MSVKKIHFVVEKLYCGRFRFVPACGNGRVSKLFDQTVDSLNVAESLAVKKRKEIYGDFYG